MYSSFEANKYLYLLKYNLTSTVIKIYFMNMFARPLNFKTDISDKTESFAFFPNSFSPHKTTLIYIHIIAGCCET